MSCSFDTNVLLYLASASDRADRVEPLLTEGGLISVQVLNEMAAVMRRKWRAPWSTVDEALALIQGILEVVPITVDTHALGMDIARRYQFRVYDSLLLASATLEGCDTFWTEDLQDGQVVLDRLVIRNPFA